MSTHPTLFFIPFMLVATVMVASCTQPLPNCTSAHGRYAAEYTLVDGDPQSPCAQLPGEVLGMQTYFQEGGPNMTPDYQNANVAIRSESLGAMIAYAEARGAIPLDSRFYAANSIGSFTDGFPDHDTFCRAMDFEAARVSLPDIEEVPDDLTTPDLDESQRAQPAVNIRYQWSNARFVVSADAQGTQFEADLEYQRDNCTARYRVVGLYPAVACMSDEQCDDEKNGINPDFAVRCNTAVGHCVLDAALPAYE